MTAARPAGLTVSAIICTRGRAELLPDCLASVAVGLGAGDQLIVVESGPGQAADALDAVTTPAERVFIHVERPGKCHQLNLGIAQATGTALLLTDDDVRVDPDWPDAMAAPFADPGVGLACGRVQGLTNAPGFDPPTAVKPGNAPYETWTFAHGAAMAVRTAAARQAGGFDERLGPGAPAVGEDHDFLLRVRARGWRVVVADAPVAHHLEWRNAAEDRRNALAYERGYGAVVGAALRRSRSDGNRLFKSRLVYQWQILRGNRRFGARALVSFTGGLAYGLRLSERAWLEPGG
jgi:GT2 family glycosyltransferase